jgi:hypothetical protein
MMKKRLRGIVGVCLLAGLVQTGRVQADMAQADVAQAGESVQVKDSAPAKYTVVAGDTLWGIAGRYLNDPWRWPEIWEANQQNYNPHAIFPGDVLLLCRIEGKAVVAVDQGGGCSEISSRIAAGGGLPTQTEMPDGTVKLHPQVRELPLGLAIPAIPLKEIQRFITGTRVVSLDELNRAPYVISSNDGRIVNGAGDLVYVRNRNNLLAQNAIYSVYRAGERYLDPDTNEVLGYEAQDVGSGTLAALNSEVGSLRMNRTVQEVRNGDKLLPAEAERISSIFYPSNPTGVKPGRVIRIFGSISSAAQYTVIALNRGEADGVKVGNIFAIYHRGGIVVDTVKQDAVRLPAERAGLSMVFRTFPRVSYALVMRAVNVIKEGDEARPPINGD